MPLTKGIPFDRSGATTIDVNSGVEPRRAVYFYRISVENCITEFCVGNWCGPQSVLTYPPVDDIMITFQTYLNAYDGAPHVERRQGDIMVEWESYEDGDLLVFKAPSQAHAGQPIQWQYDRRLQIGHMASREDMDRFILRGRHSVIVQGLKNA